MRSSIKGIDGDRKRSHLKVDVAVGQPIGASFIQEINVFYQQTEEGDHDLRRESGQEGKVNTDAELKVSEPKPACFRSKSINMSPSPTLSLLLLAV